MPLVMVSIFDVAVGSFNRPFFCRTVAEARRIFADEVARPDSPLNAHPEDYRLVKLGEFEETTGEVIGSLKDQQSLGSASDVFHVAQLRKEIGDGSKSGSGQAGGDGSRS